MSPVDYDKSSDLWSPDNSRFSACAIASNKDTAILVMCLPYSSNNTLHTHKEDGGFAVNFRQEIKSQNFLYNYILR